SIVHACTVGDRCVIGDDAIVLDGAVIEDDVLLEPGAVVFPRSRLAAGQVHAGSPAVPVRPVVPGELDRAYAAIREATIRHGDGAAAGGGARAGGRFVATTAVVEGDVVLASGAS